MSKQEYGDLYEKAECKMCETRKCDSYYENYCGKYVPKSHACDKVVKHYRCETGYDMYALRRQFPMWIPDDVLNQCLEETGMNKRCNELKQEALACFEYFDCNTLDWKTGPVDESCKARIEKFKNLYIYQMCVDQQKAQTAELGELCFQYYSCDLQDWKKGHLDERCIGFLRSLKKLHFEQMCKDRLKK